MIGAFVERYNSGWFLQRHGYMTPGPRPREAQPKGGLMSWPSACPQNPNRYNGESQGRSRLTASTGLTAVSGVKQCAISQTSKTSGALDPDGKGAEAGASRPSQIQTSRPLAAVRPISTATARIASRHYLHMLDDISVGAKHRENPVTEDAGAELHHHGPFQHHANAAHVRIDPSRYES